MDKYTTEVLPGDSDLLFPHCIVLKASAGSGKTHALTKRFVQFIISERIKSNNLQNILAITFSNNAAKEMKQRILKWLKELSLAFKDSLYEISSITTLSQDTLQRKAERVLDHILQNYSDFNVRTIDSFMTGLFRASSVDLKIDPDFEIIMDESSIFEYTMQKTIRKLGLKEEQSGLIERVIDSIDDRFSAFPWNPVERLLKEVKGLHKKSSFLGAELNTMQNNGIKEAIKEEIKDVILNMKKIIEDKGLELRQKTPLRRLFQLIDKEINDDDILSPSYRAIPVKKPSKGSSEEIHKAFEELNDLWSDLKDKISELAFICSLEYYNPYITFYKLFLMELEETKMMQNKLLISDINYHLSNYINENIVPDVYLKLGERIQHYLIDEFQDTSPIQWRNLYPLIENTLSQGGSLFVVGDIKQSIYGFRDADYRIMKGFEEEQPFLSVSPEVRHLNTNYRSHEEILRFTEKVFKEKVAGTPLRDAAEITGLIDYSQSAREEFKDSGYVDIRFVEKNEDVPQEKQLIGEIIGDLCQRGYRYGDIAVLTRDNYRVAQISSWLNEMAVPFVSYSSLDIRKRTLTLEIKNLLRFLDSPVDDLSFCKFLLGSIFKKAASEYKISHNEIAVFIFNEQRKKDTIPLYKRFKERYPEIWGRYFEELFRKTGYMPIYDLLSYIIKVFSLFSLFKSEEATLIKLLDATISYEGRGINILKDFIALLEDNREDGEWTILLPDDNNAVRVMTIHKAKGLGFPVVILLLYGERINRGIPYVFTEETERTYLLKINTNLADKNNTLNDLYRFELTRHITNLLNTLYVGFTRAMHEMYVIAIKGERDRFPFNILPEEYKTQRLPENKKEKALSGVPSAYHRPFYSDSIFDRFVESTDRPLTFYEKKGGLIIHNLLSRIYWLDSEDMDELIDEYVQENIVGETSIDELRARLERVILFEPVKEYFLKREGREVLLEREFVDSEGNLYRMDRVVVDHDRVTVIDFKTGHEKEDSLEGYRKQIRKYMNILRDIYTDKKIEGLIYFIDIPSVEKF